jgi:hypothetical protein
MGMRGFGLPSRARPTVGPGAPGGPRAGLPSFEIGHRLERPADYATVYRVVRAAVRQVLGTERPGLGLALSNLPPQLGAYWQVTGNLIVLNEGLVQAMRANATSPLELNSFVFVILAHEYLHALGYLDEDAVRRVTAQVAREAFGPDHLVSRMASGNLWQMYPFLAYAPRGDGQRLTIVRDFDLASSQSYIR